MQILSAGDLGQYCCTESNLLLKRSDNTEGLVRFLRRSWRLGIGLAPLILSAVGLKLASRSGARETHRPVCVITVVADVLQHRHIHVCNLLAWILFSNTYIIEDQLENSVRERNRCRQPVGSITIGGFVFDRDGMITCIYLYVYPQPDNFNSVYELCQSRARLNTYTYRNTWSPAVTGTFCVALTENKKSSNWQHCRHWWHRELSKWQCILGFGWNQCDHWLCWPRSVYFWKFVEKINTSGLEVIMSMKR